MAANRVITGGERWLLGLLLALGGALFLYGAIPLPVDYHDFADTREWLGLPNAVNVLSNLAFLAAGIAGLWVVVTKRRELTNGELILWFFFFDMVALTGFTSGLYHLAPGHLGLLFDRITIALGVSALLGVLVYERIDPKTGIRVTIGWAIFAVLAACSWYYSETLNASEQRAYIVAQGFPLLAVPLILWLYPARYTHGWHFLAGLGCYIAAKALEAVDGAVFEGTGGIISGHSLKHLAAAAGAGWLVWHLARRRAVRRLAARVKPAVTPAAPAAAGTRREPYLAMPAATPQETAVRPASLPAQPVAAAKPRPGPALPPRAKSTAARPAAKPKTAVKPVAAKAAPKPAVATASKPAAKAAKAAVRTAVKPVAAKAAPKPAAAAKLKATATAPVSRPAIKAAKPPATAAAKPVSKPKPVTKPVTSAAAKAPVKPAAKAPAGKAAVKKTKAPAKKKPASKPGKASQGD